MEVFGRRTRVPWWCRVLFVLYGIAIVLMLMFVIEVSFVVIWDIVFGIFR
jgi:hypothetical protein